MTCSGLERINPVVCNCGIDQASAIQINDLTIYKTLLLIFVSIFCEGSLVMAGFGITMPENSRFTTKLHICLYQIGIGVDD